MTPDPSARAGLAPGIRFETRPPAPASVLPRMDVAAFVGFASSGPLDVPVAVEDLPRFRDLFGSDPVLAWDPERQAWQRALLGPSVATFFRNGGRRCWVVRVAGQGTQTAGFRLAGLVSAGDRRQARLAARSPGTWAEGLRLAAAIAREPLARAAGPAAPGTLAEGAGAWVEVAGQARVREGDLLELRWPDAGVALWAFAETPVPGLRGPRVALTGLLWLELGGSPAAGHFAGPAPGERLEIPEAEARDRLGSPQPLPLIARLTLELAVRDGGRGDDGGTPVAGESAPAGGPVGRWTLSGLAFDPRHPRYFASLPDDGGLFRLPQGRADPPLDPLRQALLGELANPSRFPLAGLPGSEDAYLPLGLPEALSAARPRDEAADGDGWTGPEPPAAPDPAARDGLGRFEPAVFADPVLAGLGLGSLMAQAEHRVYLEGRPLRGLHALLPVTEVTLTALPDLTHRPWERALPPATPSLAAPVLRGTLQAGRARLYWTSVTGATGSQLERSDAAAPGGWRGLPVEDRDQDGLADREALVEPTPGCARFDRFRVRAMTGSSPGPWSNTLVLRHRTRGFRDCAEAPLVPLVLWLSASGSPAEEALLAWGHLDGEPLPDGLRVEVESAPGPLFSAPVPVPVTPGSPAETSLAVPIPRDLPRYYRVRAGSGQPWSNTVVVEPGTLSGVALVPAAETDPEGIIAVQQALLRFCAGRGDLFALLSLPRGHRLPEAAAHLAALTAIAGSDGEERRRILSFGALYHPWVLTPDAAGGAGLAALPPDGLVAGTLAAQAAGEGAWLPPANLLLSGPLALEPALDAAAERDLIALRVNPLAQRPRGFLAWGVATLNGAGEVCDVQVRRLLILLRRLALREGNLVVFEPNDATLRARVRQVFERLLGRLYQAGAFAGATPEEAFRVVIDPGGDPARSQQEGRLVVELRVLPALAVERIRVRLIQDGPESLTLEAP